MVALRITRSVVPNLFTMGNLFSGFLAIINFAHGFESDDYIKTGALYILAAALFDMLDGIMARLTRSASELGVELDSLCDVVSFGLAPAVLLYVVHYHAYGPGGLILAALPAMGGAYRLARFNIQLTSLEDKRYFRGLPIPAGAITLVSFVVFHLQSGTIPHQYSHLATNIVTLMTSIAMVSTIRYDNIPRPSLHAIRQRPLFSILFCIAATLAIVSQGQLVFSIMMIYIIGGIARHVVGLLRTRQFGQPPLDEFSGD